MRLGARISSAWFQRPFFITSPRVCFKFNSFISSSKVLPCLRDEDDEFLTWFRQKAGVGISSVLSVGDSAYGRSLFASHCIQNGDIILKVPFNVQISPDNVIPEIKLLLGDEVGSITCLAIVILVEQKMGQDSQWAPYISRLPWPGEMHNTIFWSKDELEMIRQSTVYQETINLRAQIEKEYFAIRPALDCFPQIFEEVKFKDFMHAYALVGSRAWGSEQGLSLIPFADFLNHDGASESIVLSDESKQISEVIADRDYAPGEQVLIRYGKFSNATLMLDFGFTLPYNIYDQVQIQFCVPSHDPLHRMKLELLCRHCMPTIPDFNGFDSSGSSFTLKLEVKSTRGKGRGIPQSLRAFARVLSSTSSEELNDLANDAAKRDGRLARCPLRNKGREIQAHQILISRFAQLIDEYDASIKSLGPVNFPSTCEKFSLRKKMARDLLAGELRVLKSASAWLKNYCARLSTSGNNP